MGLNESVQGDIQRKTQANVDSGKSFGGSVMLRLRPTNENDNLLVV